jgi:hypothetical protein
MKTERHKMIVRNDVDADLKRKGDTKEKIIVKTITLDDSDKSEEQEIRIEKKIDSEGNLVVRKWVNGEEVDPNLKTGKQHLLMKEGNGDVVIKMNGENGEPEKIIKIKKQVDGDGNVTVLRSVNGSEFEKVDPNRSRMKCSKQSASDGHSCKKGHEHHGNHQGENGKGFAAISNDGSIMIFATPLDKVEEGKTKRSVQDEKRSLLIEDVTFYPNPTESQFSIGFQSAEKGKIHILVKDIQGKEVLNEEFIHEGGEFKRELELKNAEPGMYVFNVIQNGKTYTHKLMVR